MVEITIVVLIVAPKDLESLSIQEIGILAR